MLLEWGADVNKQAGRDTPLCAASCSGHKEIVHVLFQWNVDVNLHSQGHISAIVSATNAGHKDIVEILLEK